MWQTICNMALCRAVPSSTASHGMPCGVPLQDTELATSAILSILRLLLAVERKAFASDAPLAALLARAKREYWTDDEAKGKTPWHCALL